MSGPGVYVPDATEEITRVEDLPKPRIERHSRNYPCQHCPFCGHRAGRWGVASRTVHDLGDSRSDRPIDLHVRYSMHRCPACHAGHVPVDAELGFSARTLTPGGRGDRDPGRHLRQLRRL